MTITDALTLRVGDYVTHHAHVSHRASGGPRVPVRRIPIRVTEVWVNATQTIVMVRLASIASTAWLDATGYGLPPAGHAWDRLTDEWIPSAELHPPQERPRREHAPHAPRASTPRHLLLHRPIP